MHQHPVKRHEGGRYRNNIFTEIRNVNTDSLVGVRNEFTLPLVVAVLLYYFLNTGGWRVFVLGMRSFEKLLSVLFLGRIACIA